MTCQISVWELFWLFCRWGLGAFSPFTHTPLLLHIMRGALYPGLRELRNRKGLCSNTDGMYFLSQFLLESQLKFVYFTCMLESKLFTNYCEYCDEVSHSSSGLIPLGIRSHPMWVCIFRHRSWALICWTWFRALREMFTRFNLLPILFVVVTCALHILYS